MVVDTTNFTPKTDFRGSRENLHLIERFTRVDANRLNYEVTIDDPRNYTRPFTVNLSQRIELDTELVDEFCLENEKSYERMQRSRSPK